MNISGTISNAQPIDSEDRNNNKYQWITIEAPNGEQITGRIGSKQGYGVGGQIRVTVEQRQKQDGSGSYNYFKKFNPQYGGPPQAPQNAPQAPSRPPQANKDRLIVAQVVYKELASMARISSAPEGSLGQWDVWLMGDGKNVLNRHVDLIMMIGEGKTPQQINPNPTDSRQMAQQFEDSMPDY